MKPTLLTKSLFTTSCLRIAGILNASMLSDIRDVWAIHSGNCAKLGCASKVKSGGKRTELDTSQFAPVTFNSVTYSVDDVQEFGEMLTIFDRENTPLRRDKAIARSEKNIQRFK